MNVFKGMNAVRPAASVDDFHRAPDANRLAIVLVSAQASTNELSIGDLSEGNFVAGAIKSKVMTDATLCSFRQEEGESNGNFRRKLQLPCLLLETLENIPRQFNTADTSLSVLIDPALRSMSCAKTAELAFSQTLAARTLLYNPGHALKNELGEAAATLYHLIQDLSPEHQLALGARLFGREGLLSGESVEVLLATLVRVLGDHRLPNTPNTVTGLDRAVVIALMGDIGALYVDTLEKSVVEGRSQLQSDTLLENLCSAMVMRGLSAPTDSVIRNIQKAAGSSVVGPLKKAERYRPPAELSPRAGIHNTGEKTDQLLRVAQNQRIPGVKWDVAHVSKCRVATTTEPLVGHMSGSPAEILHIWDMLRGDTHEMQFIGTLNKRDASHWNPLINVSLERQDQQLARVAGAAAFLVGLGYHSAVEVVEGALLYMGQNLRQVLDTPTADAGLLFGDGAATDLMSELFKDQSAVSEFSRLK
ncbi:hypothetical protein [Pseudomonas azerbaijanoccidentalis]